MLDKLCENVVEEGVIGSMTMKESVSGVGFSNNNKNTTLLVPNSITMLIKDDTLTKRKRSTGGPK